MYDKTTELLDALKTLEQANDALCMLRTEEMYMAMLVSGQQEALDALDAARRNARALIEQCAAPAQADLPEDQRTAVEFYTKNPSAALFDLTKRIATPMPTATAQAEADLFPKENREFWTKDATSNP